MALEGMANIEKNIGLMVARMRLQAAAAADECGMFLANWAKSHHGNMPRKSGWVYPPGAKRRWRVGGVGWGDVTGNLNNSTMGSVQVIPVGYRIILSAGMEYAPHVELRNDRRWQWIWPAVAAMANSGTALAIFRRHLELKG